MSAEKRRTLEEKKTKKSGKLNEKIVQVLSLGFGGVILYLDLTGKLTKEVPIAVYMLFLGGFFSGYSITNLLERFKK